MYRHSYRAIDIWKARTQNAMYDVGKLNSDLYVARKFNNPQTKKRTRRKSYASYQQTEQNHESEIFFPPPDSPIFLHKLFLGLILLL